MDSYAQFRSTTTADLVNLLGVYDLGAGGHDGGQGASPVVGGAEVGDLQLAGSPDRLAAGVVAGLWVGGVEESGSE